MLMVLHTCIRYTDSVPSDKSVLIVVQAASAFAMCIVVLVVLDALEMS